MTKKNQSHHFCQLSSIQKPAPPEGATTGILRGPRLSHQCNHPTNDPIDMNDWSNLGDILRTTRESLGWSIEDVSEQTRISQSTLQKLEKNDYSGFPSHSYARNFLGRYCDYLDIDAVECLTHFATGSVLQTPESGGCVNTPLVTARPGPRRRDEDKDPEVAKSTSRRSAQQPLMVFGVTSFLITCSIFAFMKLSETHEEEVSATVQDSADALGAIGGASLQSPTGPDLSEVPRALLVVPEKESPLVAGERGRALGIQNLSASSSPSAGTRIDFSLDSPPPRAVIVEE